MSEHEPNIEELVIEELTDTWAEFPELRLGQLLYNVVHTYSKTGDIFSIEDSKLIEALQKARLARLGERFDDSLP